MLTRQRQAQEAQRDQSQPSEQQMLLLRRQQELLRMEQAKIQQHMQQGQPPIAAGSHDADPGGEFVWTAAATAAATARPTARFRSDIAAADAAAAATDADDGAATFVWRTPPANGGFSNGGLGGGIFSSIASGGGGLFFDAPARQSNPPPPIAHAVDEISQHFATGMSMFGADVHAPPSDLGVRSPLVAAVGSPPASRGVPQSELPRTRSGAAIPKPRGAR